MSGCQNLGLLGIMGYRSGSLEFLALYDQNWENDPKKKGIAFEISLVGGFFPPIWKICWSNWKSSPIFGVKIKNLWNHHLVISVLCIPKFWNKTESEEVWLAPKNHTIQTPLQKVWLEDWTNRMKLVVIYFSGQEDWRPIRTWLRGPIHRTFGAMLGHNPVLWSFFVDIKNIQFDILPGLYMLTHSKPVPPVSFTDIQKYFI